jgi:hypothetical protein
VCSNSDLLITPGVLNPLNDVLHHTSWLDAPIKVSTLHVLPEDFYHFLRGGGKSLLLLCRSSISLFISSSWKLALLLAAGDSWVLIISLDLLFLLSRLL